MRISYARQDDVLEVPNLIEIQKDSYDWFLREGLAEVFEDISPIEDYSDQLSLEFVDYQLCKDDVKYSIEECKERDATYAAPLKVKVRLHNKETDRCNLRLGRYLRIPLLILLLRTNHRNPFEFRSDLVLQGRHPVLHS